MAAFPPVQSGVAVAGGAGQRVQLVEVGNTGSDMGMTAVADLQGLTGTSFVLAVPEGQPATAGNVLQQIALAAGVQYQQTATDNVTAQTAVKESDEPRNRTTNHKMTLRVNPPKPVVPKEVKESAPTNPRPKKSRKQNLSSVQSNSFTAVTRTGISGDVAIPPPALAPQNNTESGVKKAGRSRGRKQTFNRVTISQEQWESAKKTAEQTRPGGSAKRKRKSPVRSNIADILGEPEFVEMYYFEETDDEEEENYTGNILHLMKERQRRRDMTGQFDQLHSLVVSRGEKVSRNALLKMSFKEVTNLQIKAKRLKMNKDKLRDKNIALRNKMAELLGVSTHINYESEEEDLERVGGYSGYQSSSSAPDNDDDDESVDWGSSISSDEERGEGDFADMQQDFDSRIEGNVKMEVPNQDEDGYEAGEEESWNVGVRIKEEPVSEEETEKEPESSNVQENGDRPDVFVRVKLEPTATDTFSHKSPTNHRTAEDLEYDRYERVKIEPRSPVRRALFAESGNQGADEDRTWGGNDCATANGDQHSEALPLSLHTNVENYEEEEEDSDLASSLAPTEQSEEITVRVDPGLFKQEVVD